MRFFIGRQAERHAGVVMVDDLPQVRNPPVVIKPTLETGEQLIDWRCAVTVVGSSIGLEAVDADLGESVQIPPGIGPQRLDMAAVAVGFAAEQLVAARGRRRIEAARRRWRRRDRDLIELERRKLRGDLVIVRRDVRQIAEAVLAAIGNCAASLRRGSQKLRRHWDRSAVRPSSLCRAAADARSKAPWAAPYRSLRQTGAPTQAIAHC